jgi:hypothetical protein
VSDEFKDNSEEYKELRDAAIRRGLRAIGMTAETYAKSNCPVDTGYARNSITYALSGESANISAYQADKGKGENPPQTGYYKGTAGNLLSNLFGKMAGTANYVLIGSNVEYFPYIEEGARGGKAWHTLRRAATEHKDEYKQLLTDSIENA